MAKQLNLDNIKENLFDSWLNGFKLENPDDFFKEQPDNVDLVCNIQSEFDFMI